MHIIKPRPIHWVCSSTSKDELTLTLTTNPKPKHFMDEMIGAEAQILRRLKKFDYFDLVIKDEKELEQLIEMATLVLKVKRHGA